MICRSTRNPALTATVVEAATAGLAPDGGLYLPDLPPPLDSTQLRDLRGVTFGELAGEVSAHLLGDELGTETARQIARRAHDFDTPVRRLDEEHYLLELFHGPTLAFKDVGARFLARLLSETGARDRTVLAATSGDTGGAVADAFHELPGFRVVVLFPKGRVSRVQEAQFTTLGTSVTAVAVRGSFDDCQRLAKEAFADPKLTEAWGLTSANSINVGRLLPQLFYYIHAWLQLDAPPHIRFSVPCGNLGNLTAGVLATHLGVTGAEFVAAVNENDQFVRWLRGETERTGASVPTLSNAMDVAVPSNLERLKHLDTSAVTPSGPHSDSQTVEAIRHVRDHFQVVIDPHTAVAFRGLDASPRSLHGGPKVALATAHPAKFPAAVTEAVGAPADLPSSLAEALSRSARTVEADPTLVSVVNAVECA